MDTRKEVVDYWNSRANIGDMAGTQDLIAKRLEMKTLAECFPIDSTESVIDMGCGNGMSAIFLRAIRPGLRMTGIDNADAMVAHAIGYAMNQKVDVDFEVGSVMTYRPPSPVDAIYTERTLVNLPDWDAQRAAIYNILQCLKPGGTYLMMECSQDGVDELNLIRSKIGLDPVIPPWHNRYLHDDEIGTISVNEFGNLVTTINYSAGYYYLSRVVNAWLAKQAGTKPAYDAPINRLALELPETTRLLGQGRLWVWRSAA